MIEEIVGQVQDEFDQEESPVRKTGEGEYLLQGVASLVDVNEALGTTIEAPDADTIGGFFIHEFGKLPEAGDKLVAGRAGADRARHGGRAHQHDLRACCRQGRRRRERQRGRRRRGKIEVGKIEPHAAPHTKITGAMICLATPIRPERGNIAGYRNIQRSLNGEITATCLTDDIFQEGASALGLLSEDRVLTGTDDDVVGTFMDYLVYEFRANGRRVIDAFAENYSGDLPGAREVLAAMTRARTGLYRFKRMVPLGNLAILESVVEPGGEVRLTDVSLSSNPPLDIVVFLRVDRTARL